jgi:hypothetical protein
VQSPVDRANMHGGTVNVTAILARVEEGDATQSARK